jgi:hypothetical protein
MEHFGELGRPEGEAGDAFEGNLSAVVALYDLGLDIGTGGVRGGVHMGNEADGRGGMVQIGWDRAHYIAVLVKAGLDSHGFEFIPEETQEIELFGRRRLALGIFVTLRVYGDITQESV